jgi:fibronectin type 3 domain-containing protein
MKYLILAMFFLPLPASAQHSVALTWSESSPNDPAATYNVCRSTTKGGELPCTSPLASVTTTSYTDTAVISGITYFYVTIAVDSAGKQSSASNEVSALIPGPVPPTLANPVVN